MNKEDYNALIKKIEGLEVMINGGRGSGNWGHSGRPGLRGGSGKTTTKSLAIGRMRKGVKSYDPKNNKDGGFTVSLKSGDSRELGKSSGYAVGGYGTEKIVSMKDWNKNQKKIVRDYYKENAKLLKSGDYYLGGWVPTKNSTSDKSIVGKVVLDVSRVFENKREAAKTAIKFDQDSITDFKGFDWPTKEQLAKEFGLEKELAKSSGKRQAERKNS